MHIPYEIRRNQKADFRVKYRFRTAEEGGRTSGTPFQGIRCDFSYECDSLQQYMIWPEFEDETGEIIETSELQVPVSGTARMWILDPRMRPIHRANIKVGRKCYFREGSKCTADCEVIEILNLMQNPTE